MTLPLQKLYHLGTTKTTLTTTTFKGGIIESLFPKQHRLQNNNNNNTFVDQNNQRVLGRFGVGIDSKKSSSTSTTTTVIESAMKTTTTTTTSTLAPPPGKIGIRRTDAPSRVFCPSKVSRICRKKRRKGGKGGPEDEEPLSNMGEYETWDGDEEEALDDDGGDGGDISNNGGGDDDGGDGDEEDDDEFDEKWETIIKRLEDNYQNLEAVKTVGDPYAGLNGVSGELSVLWSAGCVVTYCSAIAHSLDTVISPRDGCVDIA